MWGDWKRQAYGLALIFVTSLARPSSDWRL